MKRIACIFAVSVLFIGVYAQPSVSEATIPYGKTSANSLSVVLTGQPKNVEAVLDKKFKAETGVKGKTTKGVTAYEAAKFPSISTSSLNFYYMVEKAGKVDNSSSKVNLFISSGGEGYFSRQNNPTEMANAEDMLKGLQDEVTYYEYELAIQEQIKVFDKAIKDHDNMVKDSVNLEKRLAEVNKSIEQNKMDRRNQLLKISDEKHNLETLKGKFEEFKSSAARKEE